MIVGAFNQIRIGKPLSLPPPSKIKFSSDEILEESTSKLDRFNQFYSKKPTCTSSLSIAAFVNEYFKEDYPQDSRIQLADAPTNSSPPPINNPQKIKAIIQLSSFLDQKPDSVVDIPVNKLNAIKADWKSRISDTLMIMKSSSNSSIEFCCRIVSHYTTVLYLSYLYENSPDMLEDIGFLFETLSALVK